MAELRWNQSSFSAGQLDPKTYARDDIAPYFKGAKRITNCLVIPQGGVQSRWGTDYVSTVATINPANVQMNALLYDGGAEYLLVWEANLLTIYLEDIIVSTKTTPYNAEDIASLYFCQVQNRIIVAAPDYAPYQLIRSANAADNITAVDTVANTITFQNALTAGAIYPIQFTFGGGGSLPITSPQIYGGNRTYFIRMVSATKAQIYSTPDSAYLQLNPFDIISVGVSAQGLVQNTWAFTVVPFIEVPVYDFNPDAYAQSSNMFSIVSTATTTSSAPGQPVWISGNVANVITAEFVGGILEGEGFTIRITGEYGSVVGQPTVAAGDIIYNTNVIIPSGTPFTIFARIPGESAYLAQPVWSNSLGWPRTCAFYQGRLVLAGNYAVSNGVWLSCINEVYNFGQSAETLDDSAISYYISSGSASFIRSITSGRTLLIHTNTGTYSTQTDSSAPATPSNFFLIEQNKDGVSPIQPVFIDNQTIYVDASGNNAKNLIFDIIQGQYILNNISVISSNCIQQPVDIAAFTSPNFTDGAYVIFVNADGTLGIFQTLIAQNIAAWTKANSQMGDGTPAPYTHIASSLNNCWFLVQRTVEGTPKLFVERLNFQTRTDATTFFPNLNSNTITGLNYLAGQMVAVIADDFVINPIQISDTGVLVLPEVYQDVTVGLAFNCELALLPIGSIPQTPANLYKPMHVRAIYVNYYQTVGAQINGAFIVDPDVPEESDEPVQPMDGVFLIKLMNGWDNLKNEIVITQSEPLPMTILGVGYILEIP